MLQDATFREPKSARKDHPHAMRIDLKYKKADDAGVVRLFPGRVSACGCEQGTATHARALTIPLPLPLVKRTFQIRGALLGVSFTACS